MIIAVTSSLAAGKTHWIRNQIPQTRGKITYFSPNTDSFPIDRLYLQSEFPHLAFLSMGDEKRLLDLSAEETVYLEFPWYIDPESLESFLKPLNCHRVTLESNGELIGASTTDSTELPPNAKKLAERLTDSDIQIHRALLTGEVLDFDSLETFWQELIQGAYGEVLRVKAILNIVDGRSIYGEFTEGYPLTEFIPLNFPPHLDGRPHRFSGLEIVGSRLDKAAIADTLSDCCLSDEILDYYQQQIKESLAMEE
ncbi:MAG: hypothetical protein VKJ02_18295 [Snowella sp.]|nr:hypothetical protein [Snowella sp.]